MKIVTAEELRILSSERRVKSPEIQSINDNHVFLLNHQEVIGSTESAKVVCLWANDGAILLNERFHLLPVLKPVFTYPRYVEYISSGPEVGMIVLLSDAKKGVIVRSPHDKVRSSRVIGYSSDSWVATEDPGRWKTVEPTFQDVK